MIALFMVVPFVIGCVSIRCVSHSFHNVSFFLFFFFHHSFWPCRCGFSTFPCLREISFSSQMISKTVGWLLGLDGTLGSSSDHIIILAVRRRSWRESDSWSLGGGLF